jgi:hypothetical protein
VQKTAKISYFPNCNELIILVSTVPTTTAMRQGLNGLQQGGLGKATSVPCQTFTTMGPKLLRPNTASITLQVARMWCVILGTGKQ